MGCLNDGTMGPVVRGCRNDFDFTVTFENVVFTLIPSAIFILCSLRRIQTLVHRRIVVGGSLFQLTKLVWPRLNPSFQSTCSCHVH